METMNGRGPAIEVVARPERRRFTREYKQRVLAETDACPAGEIGAVLRREGLHSSYLTRWRGERTRGELAALEPRKRGRKPIPDNAEMKRLRHDNERLRKDLEQAQALIDLQKKLAELLGTSLPAVMNASVR